MERRAVAHTSSIVVVSPILGWKTENDGAHEIEVPVGLFKFVGPVGLHLVARERVQLGQALVAEPGNPGQKLDIGAVLGVITAELGDDDVVQLDRERCDGLKGQTFDRQCSTTAAPPDKYSGVDFPVSTRRRSSTPR